MYLKVLLYYLKSFFFMLNTKFCYKMGSVPLIKTRFNSKLNFKPISSFKY